MGQMGTGIVEWMHLDLHECERTAAMPSRDLEGYPLAALVARIGVTRSTQAYVNILTADRTRAVGSISFSTDISFESAFGAYHSFSRTTLRPCGKFFFANRNESCGAASSPFCRHTGATPLRPCTDTPVWCAPITAARATQPARLPSRVLRRQTTMVCTCGPDCTCTDGSCGCGTGSCACDPGACPAKKQKELQNKIFVGGAIAVALIATAMIVMKK